MEVWRLAEEGRSRRVQGRDVHVRFSDRTYADLERFASEGGLALNASVRLLVQRGLAAEAEAPGGEAGEAIASRLQALSESALASLVAIEQNQRLLVSIIPDGAELAERLWEEAAGAARRRLLRLEQAVAEEAAC